MIEKCESPNSHAGWATSETAQRGENIQFLWKYTNFMSKPMGFQLIMEIKDKFTDYFSCFAHHPTLIWTPNDIQTCILSAEIFQNDYHGMWNLNS